MSSIVAKIVKCEGVGTNFTGPFYKGLASSIVGSFVGLVSTTLASLVIANATASYTMDIVYYDGLIREKCIANTEDILLNTWRTLSSLVNDTCHYYEMSRSNATQMANKITHNLLGWFFTLIKNAGIGATLVGGTPLLVRMFENTNGIICKLAGIIYKTVHSCDYKGKDSKEIDDGSPGYKKLKL
jgi:hypothetical protein